MGSLGDFRQKGREGRGGANEEEVRAQRVVPWQRVKADDDIGGQKVVTSQSPLVSTPCIVPPREESVATVKRS